MKSPEPNLPSTHQTIDFLASLMDFCSKHVKRISKKLKTTPSSVSNPAANEFPPKSPMRARMSPKKILTNITHRKKKGHVHGIGEESFGDGGVWQRSILMGDRCQPLDFPGVIYYDRYGKRLDEVPARSPRASPLPGFLTAGRKVEA